MGSILHCLQPHSRQLPCKQVTVGKLFIAMAEDKKTSSKAEELGDDLDGLQLAINEKSDDTLECTRRMREMCAEAKDSGMKTLIALDDQEELIDKFEAAADGINADMALAEKALKVVLRTRDLHPVASPASWTSAGLMLSRSRFCFPFLSHHLPHHSELLRGLTALEDSQLRGLTALPFNPSFCTF